MDPDDCAFDNNHPLWGDIGLNRFSVVVDWMHSCHLGVLLNVIGSAFDELAETYEGHGQEQVSALWLDIQQKHRDLGSQKLVYTLTGNMFQSSANDYARLRHVRAADAVSLLPVCTALCREHNDGSEHDMHRLIVLEALEQREALLRTPSCKMCFGDAHAAALEAAGERIMLQLSALSYMAMVQGVLRYAFTVKTHEVWHIVWNGFV